MSETYQFIWGEVGIIKRAIALAEGLTDDANYSHIETKDFDLDADRIGIRVTIPHMKALDEERKTI